MTEGLPSFEKDYLHLQDRVAQLERLIRRRETAESSEETSAECCVDVSCKVYRDTDYPIPAPSAWQVVPFETALWDSTGMFDVGTPGQLTAIEGGRYSVGASWWFDSALSDRGGVGIGVRINGVDFHAQEFLDLSSVAGTEVYPYQYAVGISTDITLLATEYVEFMAWSDLAGDSIISVGSPMVPWAWAHRFAIPT